MEIERNLNLTNLVEYATFEQHLRVRQQREAVGIQKMLCEKEKEQSISDIFSETHGKQAWQWPLPNSKRGGVWMRGFILAAMCLVIFALPLIAQEGILANYGSLKVGGIMQSWFTYNMDTTKVETELTLKRSRLLFWGTITDQVKYFVQTEGLSSPYILDTKFMFSDFIPMTTITVGRFCPAFTHYMPMSAAKLDMINYPILVTFKGALGNEMAYAMWKQDGIQTTTVLDYVDFNLGVFNGYGSSLPGESNDAKDALASVVVKPVEFLQILGYGWFGSMLIADDADLAENRYGGGAIGHYPINEQMSVVFKAEVVMGSDEQVVGEDVGSMGYYGHLGFHLNPMVEILGRYESFDPNVDVDDDSYSWITGGANFRLVGDHVKFSANYIMKTEEAGDYDNDQFIFQTQLFF
jgi:hypothetical protein